MGVISAAVTSTQVTSLCAHVTEMMRIYIATYKMNGNFKLAQQSFIDWPVALSGPMEVRTPLLNLYVAIQRKEHTTTQRHIVVYQRTSIQGSFQLA